MTKTVFAIKDTHSNPVGRNRAKAILESGGIKAFFIEWPKPIEKDAIVSSFEGLARSDAEPSLIRLATIAISKGIDVISCDLTVSDTVAALNALNDGYGPYGDPSAFQPWGKGIRDRHAAEVIRNYMLIHPDKNCRGLVMFGSDHFEPEYGRNVDPLHKLIKARYAIDCFIVDNNSSDVSF
jgi:hypothetical protein